MTDEPRFERAFLRAVPASIPFYSGLRLLPLVLALTYLGTLFALFLAWPINWPIYRTSGWVRLIVYVLACYGLFAAGYLLSTGRVRAVAEPFKFSTQVIIAGALVGFLLLFPISRIYTNHWPWEVITVIGQQGEAYKTLQEQLEETAGQRGLIAIVRALFAPLTFAVVPFGIVHWARLTWFQRGFLGLSIATTILISLLRGTDREFADLVIVGCGSLLIALGRSRLETSNWIITSLRRYWPLLIFGALFLAMSATMFSERKTERLGNIENRAAACVNDSTICADIDAPAIAWMPLQARFATSLFILSSASGFYGLEIAMEKDFEPTYGVGHSPAALSVYELITGDQDLKRRTYTYRNSFDGWSDLNYWSTLMTWIANDVGFGGTLVVILGLGWLFGRAWRAATIGHSDPAAVMFCALMISVFYLTANNQLLGSYDGYFVVATWGIAWFREKRRRVVTYRPA